MKKPGLKKIDFSRDEISIWLSNEAHIKYEYENNEIIQSQFAPDDPHSAWERNDVGPREDNLSEYALTWIEWYLETPIREIADDDFNSCLIKEVEND